MKKLNTPLRVKLRRASVGLGEWWAEEDAADGACGEVERDEREERERFDVDERGLDDAYPLAVVGDCSRAKQERPDDREERIYPMYPDLLRISDARGDDERCGRRNRARRRERELCSRGLRENDHERTNHKESTHLVAMIVRPPVMGRDALAAAVAFKRHTARRGA